MLKVIKDALPALKIGGLFLVLTFILQYLFELSRNNWGFSTPKIDEYTFILPVLVFAWQYITTVSTNEVNSLLEALPNTIKAGTNEVNNLLKTLPNVVREGTLEDIKILKEDNEEFRRQIAKGVIEHEEHTYRTLTYKKDEGALFNRFEDSEELTRNVLFSNKTINYILREVRDIDRSDQMLLHHIGKSASERFAVDMVEDIQKKYTSVNKNLTDWLDKWIEFDTDAGFGKFELEGDKKNWKKKKVILLKYSFLTDDCLGAKAKRENTGLCRFMSGYLEGIINSFPHEILEPYGLKQGNINILHDTNSEKECICAGRPPHKGCRFHIVSK